MDLPYCICSCINQMLGLLNQIITSSMNEIGSHDGQTHTQFGIHSKTILGSLEEELGSGSSYGGIGKFLFFILFGILALYFLLNLFTPQRQGLHEKHRPLREE